MGIAVPSYPEEMVILIIDPTHPRFGQLARVEHFDRPQFLDELDLPEPKDEIYRYSVIFTDGVRESFPDECNKGIVSKVKTFHVRCDDFNRKAADRADCGPESLKIKFLELGIGGLEKLTSQYKTLFGEELPATP